MKTSTIPVVCGVALAAMTAAGVSHWWSVRQFASAIRSGLPAAPISQPVHALPETPPPSLASNADTPPRKSSTPDTAPRQQEFYEALIQKMASVESQNRDLLDQLAETNRDLMKLEFRVDTHSESFRPLPVSEDQPFSTFNDSPGVLPPRAEPVYLPSNE